MSGSPIDERSEPKPTNERAGERLVYVMPERALGRAAEDEISLRELWGIVWRGKWLIIVVTALFALGSVAYALTATEWYRADVLLAPSEAKSTSSLGGQLGGLAALAGVSVGGGETAEAVATLKSRDLARIFIESNSLVPILLYEKWDAPNNAWKVSSEEEIPDIRDAVEFFHENVLSVQEAKDTGLVTVTIEWIDSAMAAEWVSEFVQLANARLRQRALQEAEANVAYLQAELAATTLVTLQQSVGRLLEAELQKLMLARGNKEFAFRTVDAAEPPKKRSRPRRALVAVIGTLLGGMLAIMIVFVRHAVGTSKAH